MLAELLEGSGAGRGLSLGITDRGLADLTGRDRADPIDEIAEVEGLPIGLETVGYRGLAGGGRAGTGLGR